MKPRRILQVSLALNVLLGLALLLHAPKATPDASVPVVVPSTFETPVIAATGDVRNPAREAFR